MKEWITNYMISLLAENETKLPEILGVLSLLQCLTIGLVGLLMVSLQATQTKVERIMSKIGKDK